MTATVVDLFSGVGGASLGFARHPRFTVSGAADAQLGKPSSRAGSLSCNATYRANIGVAPVAADLGVVAPDELAAAMGLVRPPDVLIACPPCTGFSRTLATNHLRDDPRNHLVPRVAEFVRAWTPAVLVMENARELVMGRYRAHLDALTTALEDDGYTVHADTYRLDRFGLAQQRERAIVLATRAPFPLRTLDDLWAGLAVHDPATHVRRAIGHLPTLANGAAHPGDPAHRCSRIARPQTLERIRAIPHDGGSWRDLRDRPELLTPTMRARVGRGNYGSYPDVYGRMRWDKPAPTIKRECSHVGNGRYAHPEQDRLCSIRELALLNGFPADFVFAGGTNNSYRHVGDAVPPLISYQLAWLADWILGNAKPGSTDFVLPGSTLRPADVRPV